MNMLDLIRSEVWYINTILDFLDIIHRTVLLNNVSETGLCPCPHVGAIA
jgi:hypothetical protein